MARSRTRLSHAITNTSTPKKQQAGSLLLVTKMRLRTIWAAVSLLVTATTAQSNATEQRQSQQILHADFKPPQVFENVNLVRTTNLEKGYVRETINIVVSNVDKKPQSEYYLPFEYDTIGKIGGIEVRDKKDAAKPLFNVRLAGMTSVTGADGTSTKYEDPAIIGTNTNEV